MARHERALRLAGGELEGESNGGGGGSWSTEIAAFSNDLSESKRPTGKIGQKALVQVQNRYSRWVLTSNHPTSATGST